MRIAMINTYFGGEKVGGAEVSVTQLCEALVKEGHSVTVLSLVAEPKDSEVIEGVQCDYIVPPFRLEGWDERRRLKDRVRSKLGEWFDREGRRLIRRWLEDTRPDLLNTQNLYGFSTSAWTAAASLSIPVVHTGHDYYLLCKDSQCWRNRKVCKSQCWDCGVLTRMSRVRSHGVAGFIAVSDYVLDQHLKAGLFPEAIRLVLTPSVENPGRASRARRLTRAEASPIVLGTMGRIIPCKGIELAIEAFLSVARRRDEPLLFKVAGRLRSAYAEELKARYESDQVMFCGYRESTEFFSELDALVFPSLWPEPSGRGLSEALGRGCPVLAGNGGGMPEAMRVGEDGLLFDVGDSSSLEQCYEQFIEEVESWRGKEIVGPHVTSLSEEVRLTCDLYEQVLKSRTDPFADSDGAR